MTHADLLEPYVFVLATYTLAARASVGVRNAAEPWAATDQVRRKPMRRAALPTSPRQRTCRYQWKQRYVQRPASVRG